MKRFAWVMIVTLALTSTMAFCAKEKKGRDKNKGGLKGEYAIMASVLAFSGAQKTELAAKLATCAEKAKKWREANADKIADIKERQAKAKEDKDREAAKKIAEEARALRAEETKIRGAAIEAAKALGMSNFKTTMLKNIS